MERQKEVERQEELEPSIKSEEVNLDAPINDIEDTRTFNSDVKDTGILEDMTIPDNQVYRDYSDRVNDVEMKMNESSQEDVEIGLNSDVTIPDEQIIERYSIQSENEVEYEPIQSTFFEDISTSSSVVESSKEELNSINHQSIVQKKIDIENVKQKMMETSIYDA